MRYISRAIFLSASLAVNLTINLSRHFMLQHLHHVIAVALQPALPAVQHIPVEAVKGDAVSVLQFVLQLPENVTDARVSPVVAPSRQNLIAFDGQVVLVCNVEHNGHNSCFLCVSGSFEYGVRVVPAAFEPSFNV